MYKVMLRVIGSIQIVLGLAYLFLPQMVLQKMGHSVPAPDLFYPLGMLASRFIAYGLGFLIISGEPAKHILWIRLMVLIQFIDLSVGLFYTTTTVVPVSLSAFPMFNAVWIGLLLLFWNPSAMQTKA